MKSHLAGVLFEASEISKRIAEMAQEIERDYAGKELSIVVLMDGALFFVADLLRLINLPLRIHSLSVSSYHGETSSSGEVKMPQTLTFDFRNRHVLLLDDILDTGLTLSAVQQIITDKCQPESLRTAVLLDKKRPRLREAKADYVGFEIEDEFVVGYGMDFNGHYRNLPCIGILHPSRYQTIS